QFFVGSSLANLAVAYLFIPAFYRYDCTTIYEFLRHRFGPASQVTGSIFFFITRLLGSGVRLMAAALAVAVLVGWPLWATIALFTVVSIASIRLGGVQAGGWSNGFRARTLLTVETRGERQRTLALTPIGTLVTLLLYLAIGAGLFTFYAQHPGEALPRPDEIFPFFIRTVMPELLRGVMLTAIVLASIDSPLG